MTIIWLLIVIALALIEVFTINLCTIWFIVSGIVALILSIFDVTVSVQIATFVILGTVLLFTTRKPLEKMLNKTKQKTNIDRVLDMEGIVTEEIDKNLPGEVKVDGKKWTAISDHKIPKDATVKILKIEGVKLIVEEVK